MKKIAAILSVIIFICFFLPWMQINAESGFSLYGKGHAIDPVSMSGNISFIKMIGKQFSLGYLSILWIMPFLSLAGSVYAIADRKNGSTWLTMDISIIAFFLAAGLGIFLGQYTGNSYSADGFVSTGISINIGLILTILTSTILWFVSIANNVKYYNEYKKTRLFHTISPIFILIGTVAMLVIFEDKGMESRAWEINSEIMFLLLSSLAIGMLLSSGIIFLLHKMSAEDHKPATEVIEETVQPPKVKEERTVTSSSVSINKKQNNYKYIYWITGALIMLLAGWFIFSNANNKEYSIADLDKIFTDKYNARPDTCIRLDNNMFLFSKESDETFPRQKELYILKRKSSRWNEILKLELDYTRLGNPVISASIEKINNTEYLYLEYNTGATKKGENIDLFLYDLTSPDKEYSLSYYYYPPEEEYMPQAILSKKNEDQNINDFLMAKLRQTELYKNDDFSNFIDRFCTDKEFQLSRIKFPVSYIRKTITDESEIDSETYYDNMEGAYIKLVPVDRSDWKILDRDALTPFYDADKYYQAKWEKLSRAQVSFISGWVDSEVDSCITFEKIKGKWFLTNYYGGN